MNDMNEQLVKAMAIGIHIESLASSDVELDQALRSKGAQIRMIVYSACDMLGLEYPRLDDGTMGAHAGYFSMMDSPVDFSVGDGGDEEEG